MIDSYNIYQNVVWDNTDFHHSEARKNPIMIVVMENFTKKVKLHFAHGRCIELGMQKEG